MISLLAIPLIMLSEISLRVAPERAIPITYPDEPIVVQINEIPKGTHEISGTLSIEQGKEIPLDLSSILVRNTSPYYLTLPDIPSSFGPHTLSITIDESSSTTKLYRHLRPSHSAAKAVCMTFPEWNGNTHLIALELALKEARVFLGKENDSEAINTLRSLNTQIRVAIGSQTTQAQLEKWVNEYAQDISTWEFEFSPNPQITQNLILLLLQMQPNTQIAIRPQSPEAFQLFLGSQSSLNLHDIVLQANSNEALYRALAQQAGIESPKISIEPSPDTSPNIIPSLPPFTPVTLSTLELDLSTPAGITNLSVLNHWTEALPGYESISPYIINDDITAHLFRSTNPELPWLIAINSTTIKELIIPESLGSSTVLSRHFSPLSKAPSDTITLDTQPIFLSGTNSEPIVQALRSALNGQAITIMANKDYTAQLPKNIQAHMNTFITATPETTFRAPFLSIVQQFPVLEAKYFSGDIPQSTAIPLIARLAQIARLVATLEQYTGDPFLESPSTTLAKCNNFLADYLSRDIPQADHSRESTLLAEINRLMTQAQALEARSLTTEATAVATIAEWRARALLRRTDKPAP
jgi:hypothetical protein